MQKDPIAQSEFVAEKGIHLFKVNLKLVVTWTLHLLQIIHAKTWELFESQEFSRDIKFDANFSVMDNCYSSSRPYSLFFAKLH